jgi:DNA repair ATPase RecN
MKDGWQRRGANQGIETEIKDMVQALKMLKAQFEFQIFHFNYGLDR